MLLLKKVTSNSDIESLHIPFAEQNIYLLAQDASGRQIFGHQTIRGMKNWPNSFFITPTEFNATLLPDIQRHGQPQTATVDLTLKFNMLGNAPGMHDWMLQNNITSLEDKDLSQKLQHFAHNLGGAIERHLAKQDDYYLTCDELADVFPCWLQVIQIRSLQIGPRLAKPIAMASPSAKNAPQPPPPPIAEKPKTATPPPQTSHQPPCNKTANPPNLSQKNEPQKQPKRKTPRGCCCSHFFLFLLLIFCIIFGGLVHLVKAVKNAIVRAATPVIEWVTTRPASPTTIIKSNGEKASFMLPSNIPLELLKVKAGSYQPTSPYGSVQPISYQITIPKDYWLSEQEITDAQWRTMMSTSLNTMGVGLDEVNDFCRRLTSHFANQLPQGYHFALPTDAEWNLAVMQYKGRLAGLARRSDAFATRLYGFHLALVPDGK